jgi:transcriptional regulator with XRE-family HTH domain
MRLEQIIGINVKRERLRKGLSQEKLAAEVGVDMRYLGGIERGQENPTAKVIAALAKALGVPASSLLTEIKGR